MTRSRLLPSFWYLLTLFISLNAIAQLPQKGKYLFYVGTYTENGSKSKGIYAYRYDAATQEMTPLELRWVLRSGDALFLRYRVGRAR